MLPEKHAQFRFARRSVERKLSVHALENLITRHLEGSSTPRGGESAEDEETEVLRHQESKIGKFLGIEEVKLKFDSQGRKCLNLVFETEAAWRRFMSRIRHQNTSKKCPGFEARSGERQSRAADFTTVNEQRSDCRSLEIDRNREFWDAF